MTKPPVILLALGVLVQNAFALDYKRDIMPIFEEKCFRCHSEAEKVKGGLRLDDPKAFYKRFAKNNIVVPGDWDGSYLFVVISRAPGSKEAMPPKTKQGDGKSLTPEEVMKVAKWIYEGARIDGEKGKKGSKDDNPEDYIKFKRGVMVTDGVDAVAVEKEEKKKQKPQPRDWTNTEGKKISAIYRGIENGTVILELKEGKTVRYPIKKLSEKSRGELAVLVKAERVEKESETESPQPKKQP